MEIEGDFSRDWCTGLILPRDYHKDSIAYNLFSDKQKVFVVNVLFATHNRLLCFW